MALRPVLLLVSPLGRPSFLPLGLMDLERVTVQQAVMVQLGGPGVGVGCFISRSSSSG